jgi:3-hydroxyacyl-[acyl-carrier-protein] dehydratase
MESFDTARIMEMIPHRPPMLLIERVEQVVAGESATGIKTVVPEDMFLQGHFPGHPVMPGVMIVEAMAQSAAVLAIHSMGAEAEGKIVYFMTISDAKFRRPVTPGDELRLEVKVERARKTVWRFSGRATVNGELAAEASFSAMVARGE